MKSFELKLAIFFANSLRLIQIELEFMKVVQVPKWRRRFPKHFPVINSMRSTPLAGKIRSTAEISKVLNFFQTFSSVGNVSDPQILSSKKFTFSSGYVIPPPPPPRCYGNSLHSACILKLVRTHSNSFRTC